MPILPTVPADGALRPEVARIRGVSKKFTIRKDSSIKERVVTLGRAGRRHKKEFWALRDVDLDIYAGETIGLIGHNGSGKSTLLKVIGGIVDPTSGTVEERGRLAALLELGAGFHPDLTGRENVFLNASVLGLSREETEAQFDDIVAFASIGDFIDTQVKFYSSGMYVRLAFAVAVHTDPDVLLVDEVLAVGDEAFQRKCMDRIREFQQQGRTIILVTHSLDQVVELCGRCVLLHQGKVLFDGKPSTAVARFRDLLEERRVAERDAAEPQVERPQSAVTGVSAHVIGKEEGSALQPEDDLEIRLTVTSTGLQTWGCRVQIDDTMGQKMFVTGTDWLDTPMPPLDGEGEVAFVLKKPALGGGKYFVNATLIDGDGNDVHNIMQATSFNVEFDPRATGYLRIDVEGSASGSR
ncbi:ABC transporter ATP-binding protein [Microbacterium testaceum]|uniref:ABC transporter ATP-binding protein n=1 Tax=Microbacterium testaceum TaxID=2033 RepID=UPI0025B2280A|nr:ABC transporter ATP-binding protein [Microbacterium testaceum]WJS91749.1 ABC transporter ATP-binding protein [Microbacterium testaceum]